LAPGRRCVRRQTCRRRQLERKFELDGDGKSRGADPADDQAPGGGEQAEVDAHDAGREREGRQPVAGELGLCLQTARNNWIHERPGFNVVNFFKALIYECINLVFVPVKPFQFHPSFIFEDNTRAYSSLPYLLGAPI